ncbi:Transferase domain-containing protein [Cephalotus follicularis]|uniref:Transferase domain-containing protein n=1 Tax=Cephalotus follicularis TaxID=3775 RepID=A0A1Q3BID0_CEPFO|nr:Transferase domain-containing protein [Cephalotus follicularis]
MMKRGHFRKSMWMLKSCRTPTNSMPMIIDLFTSFPYMAMLNNDTTNLVSKLQIKALQSAGPTMVTDPRLTRRVFVTDPIGSGIFQRSFNVILCYHKGMEEVSGWLVAGWMKESLGIALIQQPILCGRLKRGEDGEDDHGDLRIVASDSGMRLLEAQVPMTLQEFLDSKDKRDYEHKLVFWKDIDEQHPQFCPLFYVQVTNFECGGYSIGISCSILLADILIMGNFLKTWATFHNALVLENGVAKEPMFYFPKYKNGESIPINLVTSNQRKNCGQTIIFKSVAENENKENEARETLAILSVQKAKHMIGSKMELEFSLFIKESSEFVMIENGLKHEMVTLKMNSEYHDQLSSANWAELEEIVFHEMNITPSHVSYWIGSMDGGIVMKFPSPVNGTEVNMFVTILNEKQMKKGLDD